MHAHRGGVWPYSAAALVAALVAGLLVGLPLPSTQPSARAAAAPAPELVSFTPFRAADTRTSGGMVPAGGVLEVQVAGRLGVPADAAAVVLNVAAVTPVSGGHLTVWPCGQSRPTASTLNYPTGRTVANMALAAPGTGGKVCLYSHAPTHLIVDIAGYWPHGSAFTGRLPVRAADTRNGTGVARGTIPAGGTLAVPVAGKYGVPADAPAVAVNVAAVTPAAGGHLTVWPCGAPRPTASNVNYTTGETTADAVIVAPGTGGQVCVYSRAATHLILDVAGHLAPGSAFTGMVPVRAADTRIGTSAGRVSALGTLAVPIAGKFGVPAGAGAVSVTVTAVTPIAGGHLTVYPCGQPRPTASNVNYVAGRTMAAAAIARLGSDGSLCVYSRAATHLIVDVNGHYTADDLGAGAWAVSAGGPLGQDGYGAFSGPIGGGGSSCALLPGGYVQCWGEGFGPTPVAIPGIVGATALADQCAIVGGAVRCWGGGYGATPVVISGTAGATALAERCAIVAGAVRCWEVAERVARKVAGTDGAVAVSVGTDGFEPLPTTRVCAIIGSSRVVTCGGIAVGRLSDAIPAQVPGTGGSVAVAASDRSCALDAAGTVRCWPDGGRATAVPALAGATALTVRAYTQYYAGSSTTEQVLCAIVGGRQTCATPAGTGVTGLTALATGGRHFCGIVAGGNVHCWGNDWSGNLGNGRVNGRSAAPVTVPGISGATDLDAEYYNVCALASGKVMCWGGSSASPDTVFGGGSAAPVPQGTAGASDIAMGNPDLWFPEADLCAVVAGGAVVCNGTPVPGYSGATTVAVGGAYTRDNVGDSGHVCAIVAGGAVRCSGHNDYGQLGDGTTTSSSAAVAVTNLGGTAVGLRLGWGDRSCALLANGDVKCWGDGYGTTPVKTASGVKFLGDGGCVIRTDGTVACGGTTVPGITGATHIDRWCAVVAGGTVQCWDSEGAVRTIPGITGATKVASDNGITCALVAGRVQCWGDNGYGQLGVNPGWAPVTALL